MSLEIMGFVFLLFFGATVCHSIHSTFARPARSESCSFSGVEYSVGQWWYQRLETQSTEYCVSCLCDQGFKAKCDHSPCTSINCHEDDSDECCSICDERTELVTTVPGEETDDIVEDLWERSSWSQGCSHNGFKYRDGDSFASNATGLKRQADDQCIQCVCQSGLVLCRLKTCTPPECSDYVFPDDDCCPVCFGSQTTSEESNEDVTQEIDEKDCITAGKVKKNGSQWHPVIGTFGQVDCVICQCQSGKVECNRTSCSDSTHCAHPKRIPGQCCPVCPAEESVDILKCFPTSSDTLVYQSSSSNGFYQYAFLTADGTTRLISWSIIEGGSKDFSEQFLASNEFRRIVNQFRFKFLGSTKKRLVQRFIRKIKKFTEKCSSRCDRRVHRIESVLKLKDVDEGCHAQI